MSVISAQFCHASDALDNAVLMLVNAIYFKGSWKYQFPKENTFDGKFYVGKGKSVTTPLMALTGTELYYSHATKFNAKILRLPYLVRSSRRLRVNDSER